MSRRGRILVASGLVGIWLGLWTPASAGWKFEPTAAALAGYDTNIQRVGQDQIADATSRLEADLLGVHVGPRHEFDALYRPIFEMFLDNRDLNNLSHLLRLDWRFTGAKSEFRLDASGSRTEDPRYVQVGPSTTVPTGAPFVTERTRVDVVGLGLEGTVSLARRLDFVWSGAARSINYESPTLLDSAQSGANLRIEGQRTSRVSWGAGYRYDRFDASGRERSRVHALDAEGRFRLTKAVELALNLAAVVAVSGDLRDDGNPWFGGIALNGDHRKVGWSLEYRRDYSAGGGVTVALVNQLAGGTLRWAVTPEDSLSLSVARTYSEDASIIETRPDIFTDRFSLRYDRELAQRWSLFLAAHYLEQHGNEVDDSDDFNQERIMLGVSYSVGRKT